MHTCRLVFFKFLSALLVWAWGWSRAYYRCSSSKGCPARKQVERSRVDPDKVIVTYSFEHNHSGTVPRAPKSQATKPKAQPGPATESVSIGRHDVVAAAAACASALATEAACGAGTFEVHDDFRWLYDGVSATSSTSPSDADAVDHMMYGPMFFGGAVSAPAAPLPDEFGDVGALFGGEAAEEEEAMFAGLGELPECAMVFRRHACDGLATPGGVKVEQPAEGTAMT
jgi:hypothetical protein